MASDQSLMHRADGSACISHGASSVVASVHGPVASSSSSIEEGCVVSVQHLPPNARADVVDAYKRRLLVGAIKKVIKPYPRCEVKVAVQVLRDDGSSLAVAYNACCLAMLDAGLSMRGAFSAASCALLEDGIIVVDPTLEEERAAVANLFASWDSGGSILSCQVTGRMGRNEYNLCLAKAKAAAASAAAFIRLAYQQRVQVESS